MHLTRTLLFLLIATAVHQAQAQGLGATAMDAAVVKTVTPGSLAAAAGMKPGDVILEVDGKPVSGTEDLPGLTRTLPVNGGTITVSRAGQLVSLRVAPKPATDRAAAPAPAAPPAAPAASARPVAAVAPVDRPAPAAGAPTLGNYGCTERWLRGTVFSGEWVTDLKGYFELMPGGRYHYLDGGEVGQYTYDPAARKLHFKGGYFGNIDATGEYTPRDTGAQIDIVIPTNNRTDRWICGYNPK